MYAYTGSPHPFLLLNTYHLVNAKNVHTDELQNNNFITSTQTAIWYLALFYLFVSLCVVRLSSIAGLHKKLQAD